MEQSKVSSERITTLIIIFPLISLLLYGGLSHIFFFFTQYKESKDKLEKSKQIHLLEEQYNLKESVETLEQFINYYNNKSNDMIKDDVKHIVNTAANIVNNLYDSYKDKIKEDKLKEIIKNALKKIKFERNIGYLFLLNLKGDALIHIDSKIVGTNVLNIRDAKGKYIIKEFNKVLKKKGEGFVDYYWYITSKNRKAMYKKISFVKMLKCYDWYIGAGEYLKYMKHIVQQDILKYIKTNSTLSYDYFFILNSKGEILFQPQKHFITDLKPYTSEGIHINNRYISYTKYIPKHDWYISRIEDLKSLDKNLDKKRKEIEEKKTQNIKTNLYLIIISWIVSILLSIYLSTIINRKLRNYENKLNETNEKLIFQSRQALMGELFSMIAHQWRQPINRIASILALLRLRINSKNISYIEIDKKCHAIEDDIEFMSETIDDFRTFYQPKNDAQEVNLKNLIIKSLNFLEGHIRKKNIHIITELEDIEFKLYHNEFLQVMINIIKNAIDALDEYGKIIIRLYKNRDNRVVITVEDNGSGIPKEIISKLFDPYFSTKEDSMGLGLYMTKMIIEKHMKGTITAENRTRGAKFTIIL